MVRIRVRGGVRGERVRVDKRGCGGRVSCRSERKERGGRVNDREEKRRRKRGGGGGNKKEKGKKVKEVIFSERGMYK